MVSCIKISSVKHVVKTDWVVSDKIALKRVQTNSIKIKEGEKPIS